MYFIPKSIWVDGKEYRIRNDGDYRVILDCFRALEDVELSAEERLLAALIIFYLDFNTVEDVNNVSNLEDLVTGMYNFFNCDSPDTGTKVNKKLIDWEQDEQLLCSAINKVAGFEIRSVDYLHWWTFMGFYIAIGDCPLSSIIQIRDKIVRGEPLEKHERKYRMANPQYFTWNSKTVEESEAEKLVRELWDSGG